MYKYEVSLMGAAFDTNIISVNYVLFHSHSLSFFSWQVRESIQWFAAECWHNQRYTHHIAMYRLCEKLLWHVVKQYKRWWNVYPTINNNQMVSEAESTNNTTTSTEMRKKKCDWFYRTFWQIIFSFLRQLT